MPNLYIGFVHTFVISMNALEETKIKLLAVDCLKVMKETKTFRTLSREISLPSGVLNRYINGYVLPKLSRAESIIKVFDEKYFEKLIMENAKKKGSKYLVTADILSKPFLLELIAFKVNKKFDTKITKIFTAAADGIPISTIISNFLGCRSIYAKQTQEMSFSDFYTSKSSPNLPLSSPLFLPKNLLKRGDNVLIVDDVIRAGKTYNALISICDQAKADIAGVFAIFITKSAYNSIKRKYKVMPLFIIED